MSQPLVTFVFPDKTGMRTGVCHVPWRPNATVQQYLHDHPLRAEGLITRWMRTAHWNKRGERIKLTYQPTPGDAVVLSSPIRPMS